MKFERNPNNHSFVDITIDRGDLEDLSAMLRDQALYDSVAYKFTRRADAILSEED